MSYLREQIKKDLEKAIGESLGVGIEGLAVNVSRPRESGFGDYATNVALQLASASGKGKKNKKDSKQSSLETAKILTDSLSRLPYVEKLEVKKPGFINIFIKTSVFLKEVEKLLKGKDFLDDLAGKKIIVEFTDPNPFKEFHVGHLYSNVVGEAISRLFEVRGAIVKRANYQGDIGMHVAKTIWGIPKLLKQEGETLDEVEKKPLKARAFFLGQAYSLGAKEYEASEEVKKEIAGLNKKVFEKDKEVVDLFEKGRKWSMDYFEQIYTRLGTKFDFYYLESEVGSIGIDLVNKHIGKGIFEKSEGAIIFPGEKYGLHRRVFINSMGLPTYEAKELGLAPTKFRDFAYDKSVIVTGNEINDYFRVLLKALGIILPDLAEKTKHIGHGMVRMPGGKISSRLGDVILGEWLLDEARDRVKKEFKVDSKTAEQIGVGAVKYALLKGNIGQDINFSFDESINLNGNSGPYLQYTHARCQSVLEKAGELSKVSFSKASEEEILLLGALGHFEETVFDAGDNFAPNTLANYLYELAQKYNTLYNNLPILKAGDEERTRRLFLTEATAEVLRKGLELFGISAPKKL